MGETPNPVRFPWAGIKGQGVNCGGGVAEEINHSLLLSSSLCFLLKAVEEMAGKLPGTWNSV